MLIEVEDNDGGSLKDITSTTTASTTTTTKGIFYEEYEHFMQGLTPPYSTRPKLNTIQTMKGKKNEQDD